MLISIRDVMPNHFCILLQHDANYHVLYYCYAVFEIGMFILKYQANLCDTFC